LDKVFSARLDVAAIDALTRAAKRLGMTKKEFLESAIRLRVRQVEEADGSDVWEETSGAWQREETVETTRKRARSAFEKGFRRHHKKRR
jgi:hypothetical protein